MSAQQPIADIPAISRFLFAGRAKFTLKSERTQKYFTYVLWGVPVASSQYRDRWYLYSRCDKENIRLGFLERDSLCPNGFQLFIYGRFRGTSPVLGFEYFWNSFKFGKQAKNLTFLHEGACGKCGRPLTTPESIQSGIGPVCSGKRK